MRIILKHAFIVGWLVLAGWLGCEWLLPGSVSTSVPLFPCVFVWTALTLICAPVLPLAHRTWAMRLGFFLPSLAVSFLLCAFLLRASSMLATVACVTMGAMIIGMNIVVYKKHHQHDG